MKELKMIGALKSEHLVVDVVKAENGYVLYIGPEEKIQRVVVARDRWDFRKAIEDAASQMFDKLEGEEEERDGTDD